MQFHDWSISLAYCLEASFYPMGLTSLRSAIPVRVLSFDKNTYMQGSVLIFFLLYTFGYFEILNI